MSKSAGSLVACDECGRDIRLVDSYRCTRRLRDVAVVVVAHGFCDGCGREHILVIRKKHGE